jgi:UDP-glucose 4-epimerase
LLRRDADFLEAPVRILVTGGAGFIGSHIVDAFLGAGHEVTVVDNLSSGKRENVNPKASFLEMDVMDPKLLGVLRDKQIEVVVHEAAQISVTASLKDPAFDVKQNVEASVLLLDHCRRAGVKRFLFASSGGAMYGEAEAGPLPEETRPTPFSVYGVDKYAVELYADVFARNYGLETVMLRYANVYGPRQDPDGEAGVVAIFTEGMLKGRDFRIYGDGSNTRDYVFVKDVAAANLLALTHPQSDAFNIGTGIGTSVKDLFGHLSRLTGFTRPPVHVPPRPGELKKSVLDPSKAGKVLGWKPSFSLERGLAETVEYFKKNS